MDMFFPYIREKVLTEIVMEVCQFPDMTELILEMADEDAQELYHHNEDDTTMFDQALEPAAVITDDEHYLHDMAYLADCPMKFEWYDKHELVPDGGWKIAHEEEEMSPVAKTSETEVNINHI